MRSKTAFLVLIVASVLVASVPAKAETKAPDFTLIDIDGNTFTLSNHRGKVVLIDFCSTGASYCMSMHENLRTVRSSFSEDELVIISIFVGTTETAEDIRHFKEQHGGDWAYANDTDVADSYDVIAVPAEYVVDVNGYIHSEHMGVVTVDVLLDDIEEAKEGYEPVDPVVYIYLIIAIALIFPVVAARRMVSKRQQQRKNE